MDNKNDTARAARDESTLAKIAQLANDRVPLYVPEVMLRGTRTGKILPIPEVAEWICKHQHDDMFSAVACADRIKAKLHSAESDKSKTIFNLINTIAGEKMELICFIMKATMEPIEVVW